MVYVGQYQEVLGTRYCHKELGHYSGGVAPEELLFYSKEHDFFEFKALALVDGDNPDGVNFGYTTETRGRVTVDGQLLAKGRKCLLDNIVKPSALLICR